MSVEATTMANLIRWDQITKIDQLAKKARVSADEESRTLFSKRAGFPVKVEDLSQEAADELISHLESLIQEKKTA